MTRFQNNPDFVTYVQLFRQLHTLVSEGMADSPEAEALRDQMDDFWYRLTDDEIAELDRLSAVPRCPLTQKPP